MRTPLLSVSITNYNYARFIGRAIESVLNQSFEDFELIVVDNASTDHSVEVIRTYMAQDDRIRLEVNDSNRGMAYNLARSAELARGTYYVHIDADDWVLNEHAFAMQIGVLEQHPHVSFVYATLTYCNQRNEIAHYPPRRHQQDVILPGEEAIRDVMKCAVVNTGPMIRMSAFRAAGGYDTSYTHAIDIKLPIDLCAQGSVAYIHQPLYACYTHESSISGRASAEEMRLDLVRAVESAFHGPLKTRLTRETRLEALGHILTLHAVHRIFANDYIGGWKSVAHVLRVNPTAVILKGHLLALLLRTLMGPKGYRSLEVLRTKLVR